MKNYLGEMQYIVADSLTQVDAMIISSITDCLPRVAPKQKQDNIINNLLCDTGHNQNNPTTQSLHSILHNLDAIVPSHHDDSNNNDSTNQEQPLVEIIAKHIAKAGGKRLRPILALITGIIFNNEQQAVMLATAVEMIHTATLLHDDVIDRSSMRRGVPSAHTIWGEKAVILVGDYLFSQSFNLMLKTKSLEALNSLARASAIISSAEVQQLEMIGKNDINFEQYLDLISAKTAVLFAAACESVALASGCDQGLASLMSNFGLNLGICFQIIDDLLDYCGKSNAKDMFQDIRDGKMTLPLMLLLNCCEAKANELLIGVYQGKDLTIEIRNTLKELIITHQLEQNVRNIAEVYALQALESLAILEKKLPQKIELVIQLIKLLNNFTLALVQREE